MNPSDQNTNPYDFLNETKKPRKPFKLGNAGKRERMLLVAGGGALLAIIIVIIFGTLAKSGGNATEDLITLAQQQTELVRVATIGTTKARGTAAQNLAVTTAATIQSDQTTTLALLQKSKIKVSSKQLLLGKNTKTDLLLTQAEQNNQFDEVFTSQITAQLTAYQKTIKKAYDASSGKTTLAILTEQFRHTETLLLPTTNSTN